MYRGEESTYGPRRMGGGEEAVLYHPAADGEQQVAAEDELSSAPAS